MRLSLGEFADLKTLILRNPTITILLFLFFTSTTIYAQVENYDLQYLSAEQGLSGLSIITIFQDKDGVMWFGTDDGVNRFDGLEFKVFSKKENGLISNRVSQIHEDHKNKLWFGYYQTDSIVYISIFDKKLEKAISFDEYFPNAPFKQKDIYHLFKGDDEIWIITFDGALFRYHDDFDLVIKNKDFSNLPLGQTIGDDLLIRLREEMEIYDQNGVLKHNLPIPTPFATRWNFSIKKMMTNYYGFIVVISIINLKFLI